MKRLVIAEKPSVAMSIAAVLGVKDRKDGYMEGADTIVSWCVGHLAALVGPEAYSEKFAKWDRADLPIIPAEWKYKVPRDKHTQFEVLRRLMGREDVSEVVNACDAGREGELIFRNVYAEAGCAKPILRLWISSMEDSAIVDGFKALRPGAEYDDLFAAARCREWADWLVGINATRLFSVVYHRTLKVGRVMSPTLAMLVEREAQISAFTPEKFYTVELDLGGFTAESERIAKKADADAILRNTSSVTVKSVNSKEKSEKAPALYDLTTLQREANRALGYTAQQTLDYLQSLYEKKLCTYPRTDSRYLTDDMADSVASIVDYAAAVLREAAPGTVNAAQVCDSRKVSDHHAIVPTAVAGKTDPASLPSGEREVLMLVSRQVLRAVSGAYRCEETSAVVECAGQTFTAKGKVTLDMGWKVYADNEAKNSELPALRNGDILPVTSGKVREGKTTPPSHFTEDTLLSAMETAGANYGVPAKSSDFVGKGGAAERARFSPSGGNERYGACDDAPEDAERKGLGTPATRAGIIEKLIATGFVERKKAKKTVNLIPTGIGVSLVTVLPAQLQSPLLTAEWENRLKMVERGELDPESFMEDICRMVRELTDKYTPVPGAEVLFPSGREAVGKCPRCGGDVTESKQGFFCEKNDCRFALWKDNKFLTGKKITLTKKLAAELLKNGRAFVKGIWSEKTGKTFDATLTLTDDGKLTRYGFDFKEGSA